MAQNLAGHHIDCRDGIYSDVEGGGGSRTC